MSRPTYNLDLIADQLRQSLSAIDTAREKTLPLYRDAIRHCSNAIRAVHRQESDQAIKLLDLAGDLLDEAKQSVAASPELGHAGFIRDAQKEFAEGSLFLALVSGQPLPTPDELDTDPAAYLNGLGEAVGELRRYLMDSIRKGDLSRGEELLNAMDDIYNVLVTMDFPDTITGGLRRTTDMVRGVVERTRSDLTLVLRQKELENRLDKFDENLQPKGD